MLEKILLYILFYIFPLIIVLLIIKHNDETNIKQYERILKEMDEQHIKFLEDVENAIKQMKD